MMNKALLTACLPVLFCCVANAGPGRDGIVMGAGPGMGYGPGMGEGYFSVSSSVIDFGDHLNGYGVGIGFGNKLGRAAGFTAELDAFNIHDSTFIDSTDIVADGGGYHLSLGPEFYLSPNLSIFATAGILHYSFDYTASSDSGTVSETTGVFGGGLRFGYGPNVSLQFAYKAFETDQLTFSDSSYGEGSVYSAGLGVRF